MGGAIFRDLGVMDYMKVYDLQRLYVEKRKTGEIASDIFLLTEHPGVFTLGRRGGRENLAVSEDFLKEKGVEIIHVERGGNITYHGRGQLVVYPIIDLRRAGLSISEYIFRLEEVMILLSADFGVEAGRDQRNHGVWIGDCKLGSVGIAVRHGITFHGMALNINTSLESFGWIHPCGLTGVCMTSLAQELKKELPMFEAKRALVGHLQALFKQSFTPFHCRWRRMIENKVLKPGERGRVRKPEWLKRRLPSGPEYERLRSLLSDHDLTTVCQEARCPNQFECYSKGTATFMILGKRCTRNCGFCAVEKGSVIPPDPLEADRVSEAVEVMGLRYVVVTSVSRDDLADGGASLFAATIKAIKTRRPATLVEVLIPDLQGDRQALETILQAGPDVLNHNIETVPRLYQYVRPEAVYLRSVDLLRLSKRIAPEIPTKTGLMVGLGEREEEFIAVIKDALAASCDILTIGQYLQPTSRHLTVRRYFTPDDFQSMKKMAYDLGFAAVAAGPFVRSSYQAEKLYRQSVKGLSEKIKRVIL